MVRRIRFQPSFATRVKAAAPKPSWATAGASSFGSARWLPEERSSIGRASVSKTEGWGFETLRSCQAGIGRHARFGLIASRPAWRARPAGTRFGKLWANVWLCDRTALDGNVSVQVPSGSARGNAQGDVAVAQGDDGDHGHGVRHGGDRVG